jgi:hypothetical protein
VPHPVQYCLVLAKDLCLKLCIFLKTLCLSLASAFLKCLSYFRSMGLGQSLVIMFMSNYIKTLSVVFIENCGRSDR